MILTRRYALALSLTLAVASLLLSATKASAKALTCDSYLSGLGNVITVPRYPQTPSNSAKLMTLETDSKDRLEWIRAQNGKFNEDLKSSPSTKNIQGWLFKILNKERVLVTKALTGDAKLQIILRGLGRNAAGEIMGDDLVLKTNDKQEVLLSSTWLKRNGTIHFVDVVPSADGKRAALVYEENGSTDKFKVIVYDLESKTQMAQAPFLAEGNTVYWSQETLYYLGGMNQYYGFDFSKVGAVPAKLDSYIRDETDGVFILSREGKYRIRSGNVSKEFAGNLAPKKVIGRDGDKSVIVSFENRNTDQLEVRRFALPFTAETGMGEVLASFQNTVVRSVLKRGQRLFVKDSFGPRQSMTVFSLSGEEIASFDAPEGTSIQWAIETADPAVLEVQLTSNVVEAKKFLYDVKERKFRLPLEQIRQDMLTTAEHTYESFYTEFASADGTMIPVRITKRKDLKRDRSNPVFMEVYGGFNTSSNFYPRYSEETADFLSRGGLLVDPALRGGNENGYAWSKVATKNDKDKTLQDLIGTSRFLVSQGYTKPELISIFGASNGGLVVAASGLTGPKDFGLVVALNGVQDLLHKEALDPSFDQGWSSEYGDSRKASYRDSLRAISPVELATHASGGAKFLIINGRNDSRVNPAHSYKLYAGLQSTDASAVRMTSVNNSGHWVNGANYQGLIAWRAKVSLWTAVYDQIQWHR